MLSGSKIIFKFTNKQYDKQFHQDYIDNSKITIFRMLEHLFTWYAIKNTQKIAVKKLFQAPWSKTPDVHIMTYTC